MHICSGATTGHARGDTTGNGSLSSGGGWSGPGSSPLISFRPIARHRGQNANGSGETRETRPNAATTEAEKKAIY